MWAFQVQDKSYIVDFMFMRLYSIRHIGIENDPFEIVLEQKFTDRDVMGNYLAELSPLWFGNLNPFQKLFEKMRL